MTANTMSRSGSMFLWLQIATVVLQPVSRTAAAATDPGSGHDAVVLEDELTVEIRSETEARERRHLRVQVLTGNGVEAFDGVTVWYSPGVSVTRFDGSVTLPSGKVLRPAKTDVYDQSSWGGYELYSDTRGRVMRFPGVVPGAIVDYTYERSLTDLFHVENEFPLQLSFPIKLAVLTVSAPPGVPIQYKVRGAAPEYTRQEVGGQIRHQWRVRDVPALRVEPGAPPVDDLVPRVEFSPLVMGWSGRRIDTSSWNGIARFQSDLMTGRLEPGPDVSGAAQQVTAGATDPAEKLRRIFEYVQNKVNYVAVELGIGGYQPHRPSDVLRYQYGDCKDKATLMLAMMRAAGLNGSPVLIRTRTAGTMSPELPALSFNHAIVAVPTEQGYQFLDPTDTTVRFGDLPWVDQGASALVVRPDGTGEFLTTALSPAERNGRRIEVRATLGMSGDLEGTLVLHASGQRRDRLVPMLEDGPNRLKEDVAELVDDLVAGARLKEHRVEVPAEEPDEVRLTVSFSVPGFVMRAGSVEILRPHAVHLPALASYATSTERSQPVFFPYLFTDQVDTTLFLPPGRELKKAPDDFEAEGPGVAAATHYETAREGGRNILTMKRHLSASRREIQASDYEAFRKFVAAFAEDESRALTLREEP